MTYPKHLINEGEVVALDLTPHWWYFASNIFTAIPLVVLAVLLFQLDGSIRRFAGLAYAILLVVWVFWLGFAYLKWRFTHFVVTSDRIIWRTGVVAKKGVEIPLERVNNINFAQSIFERMIGAGDLEIESAGREGTSFFDNVRHPDEVQQEMYRQIENNTKRTQAYGAPVIERQPNVPEQIEQLHDMMAKGTITPEEFAAKKAELLGRM